MLISLFFFFICPTGQIRLKMGVKSDLSALVKIVENPVWYARNLFSWLVHISFSVYPTLEMDDEETEQLVKAHGKPAKDETWNPKGNSINKSRPRWLSWMRRPTGDQEVAGSTPAKVGNILSWRLIMKYFLRSFSPFRWFKKGSCQFLAKECAQYWLTA